MVKRYLIRSQNFWNSGTNKNNETCLVKHDEKLGGIYAYISGKTVKLVSSQGTLVTEQFGEIEKYFHNLSDNNMSQRNDLVNILQRRQVSQKLQRLEM